MPACVPMSSRPRSGSPHDDLHRSSIIIGVSLSEPHRGTHSGCAVCHIIGASLSEPHHETHICCAVCIYNNIYIYTRLTGYRIFLNVSTRFFFTVTSRHFTGHYVHPGFTRQSSVKLSWLCSLTSLLETDRDTEVSHHSLRLLLLCSVE